GRGRQQQGKLMEAFDAYTEYGNLNAGSNELMDGVLETAVKAPPDVWAAGQIGALVASASPEQRKPLEDRIAQRWGEVKDTTDMETLRKFVAMFGAFRVGREARL